MNGFIVNFGTESNLTCMKKIIIVLFTVFALGVTACEKQGGGNGGGGGTASEKDLIAAWVDSDGTEINFTSDGKVTAKYDDGETDTYTWNFKDGKLTVSSSDPDEEDEVYDVIFAAKKNALILAQDYGVKSYAGGRFFMMYYKKGATIPSATLSDGRWDCPHSGVKPENPTALDNDYRFTLIVKGSTMDMYVHAWGFHMTGTYAINNGTLNYNISNSWQGIYREGESWGWSASGPPYEADKWANWDYSMQNMNPETFEIRAPYYYEEGDPLKNKAPFHSFKVVLTDDGKEAYGVVANLVSWFYKR